MEDVEVVLPIPIKEWSHYFVSNHGDIFNSKGLKLKPQVHHKGYLKVHLWRTGDVVKSFSIHRLVALAFIPRDIAVRAAMLDGIPLELEKLQKQIEDGDRRIDDRFKELNSKFDMFLHQEMTLLKQIARP